jgi:GGDEF domain-containing protein
MLERIGRLVTWEFATNLTDSNIMPTVVQHNAPIATPKTEPQAANVSRLDLRASLDVALANHATTDGMVGVIAFGLDNAGSLAQTYGQKTLATITKRLGKILLVKLGANDSIHSDETGRCFIVSPGTSHASCTAFAQRVCRGLANSQIAIGGTPLNFKTSAGIACAPADNAIAGGDLLTLAAKRLQRAHEAGGTRIIADDRPEPGFILSADFLSGLTRLGSDSAGGAPLGALGLHLMPVFKALEKEFEFGLPLDLIESTCAQRAKDELEG